MAGRPLGWVSLPVTPDGRAPTGSTLAALADRQQRQEWKTQLPDERGPHISVVVATCRHATAATGCVEAILDAAGERCEAIVVENRPGHSTVESALRLRFGPDPRVRYLEEARPGLSSARNAGLRAARGEIVAFTDDDVTVDRNWIDFLLAAFAEDDVDCVTGLIAPLELETPAQLLIERFAGYGKGFQRRAYSLAEPPIDQPLFPYAAGHFVSGANIAFRTEALRALGGFDEALGTGTPARGCEDLDVAIRLLLAGGRLLYEPAATVWHRHPRLPGGAHRRVFDYGAALGAMLTKHILGSDRRNILTKAPRAVAYWFDPSARKNAGRGSLPRRLLALELAGLLYGPLAYAISRAR
ncbi:MAG TPA: glycosyltransferase [Solirubrobacteraceae bacterium]|nr:glycosyltransferase [Solirubrobacteraceae bacterium]